MQLDRHETDLIYDETAEWEPALRLPIICDPYADINARVAHAWRLVDDLECEPQTVLSSNEAADDLYWRLYETMQDAQADQDLTWRIVDLIESPETTRRLHDNWEGYRMLVNALSDCLDYLDRHAPDEPEEIEALAYDHAGVDTLEEAWLDQQW